MTTISARALLDTEVERCTAAELLSSGQCDGNCLVAQSPVKSCACTCNGFFHGALADSIPLGYEERVRRPSRDALWVAVYGPYEGLRAAQAAHAEPRDENDQPDLRPYSLPL